jgi:uncharacterized protein
MAMPAGIPIIDTMIGFAHRDVRARYSRMTSRMTDRESREELEFPAEFMFGDSPEKALREVDDPVIATVEEMDRWGIERAVIPLLEPDSVEREAYARFPDRFIATHHIDPNTGMDGVRMISEMHDEYGIRAVGLAPSMVFPPVPIDDRKMYPIYAKCIELGLSVWVTTGVPGPRVPMAAQHVERIDVVMYDFPELVFVMRHGAEPWTELAVKLMVKWPGLHYSTSAFAPKHYPPNVVEYANTRGADKIIYGGYYPMGLSLERIMAELADVPFRDHVWPKFLRDNALRILHLD